MLGRFVDRLVSLSFNVSCDQDRRLGSCTKSETTGQGRSGLDRGICERTVDACEPRGARRVYPCNPDTGRRAADGDASAESFSSRSGEKEVQGEGALKGAHGPRRSRLKARNLSSLAPPTTHARSARAARPPVTVGERSGDPRNFYLYHSGLGYWVRGGDVRVGDPAPPLQVLP